MSTAAPTLHEPISARQANSPRGSGDSFRYLVAGTAIASMPIAFGCLFLSLLAVDFDLGALEDPTAMLGVGREAATLLFWSMILDMFGYYLLLTPAAVFLWLILRRRDEGLVTVYTFCGLSYILVGAIGAAVLAAVGRPMMVAYAQASASQREMIEVAFQTVTLLVYGGLWNLLEVILAGVWWVGIGLLLRGDHPRLGLLSIVLGLSGLLDAAGNILQLPGVAALGLNLYLILAPLWALCLGIAALRGIGGDAPLHGRGST